MSEHPSYGQVFLTFARNSLIRDMTFRTNFLLESLSSLSWTVMNVGFYLLVFHHTSSIGLDSGWGKFEFFVFLATTWFINSLVQAFFMPNAQEFSELIRTGNLDFALLKPIDTQFLVSFQRVDWSSLVNVLAGAVLLGISLWQLMIRPDNPLVLSPIAVLLYPVYILCGVAILYSLMISLAATSIWLGRNQSLYNFWFYITNFARYPMEIYQRGWGILLWAVFTFAIPVLVVVNVPARMLARPLDPRAWWEWPLTGFAFLATIISLVGSRMVFRRALLSYRSASS
ncbi:MAG: ABC transporter permease [Planctomycetaceae bacterium]|nr:MAG: ABC transporter permease [Planctomycetaceae bacterium]